jgi:hypothetical protein
LWTALATGSPADLINNPILSAQRRLRHPSGIKAIVIEDVSLVQ